jgi:hypothetical protein
MGRFIQLTNEMSTFGQAETNEFPSHLYAYRYFSQNPNPDWVGRVSVRVIPTPAQNSDPQKMLLDSMRRNLPSSGTPGRGDLSFPWSQTFPRGLKRASRPAEAGR